MSDTSNTRRLNFLTVRSLLAASLAAAAFVILATVEARAGRVVREAQAPPASDDAAVTFLPPLVGAPERVVRVRLEGLPEAAAVGAARASGGRTAVAWELLGQGGERRAGVTAAEGGELLLRLAGEWQMAKELVLLRVSAAGERLRPVPGRERLSLESDADLVARLERAPRTSLVVRSDATGELLQRWDLKVQQDDRVLDTFDEEVRGSAIVDDPIDPTLARSVDWVSCGASPVELEPLVSAETGLGERVNWDIEAVGFADCSISVALDAGGVHELRLAPIASANVRWRVPEELRAAVERAKLRVVREAREGARAVSATGVVEVIPSRGSEPLEPILRVDGQGLFCSLPLRGIPAGEHELRLESRRHGLVARRELAAAKFVATPGHTAEVELITSRGAAETTSTLGFDLQIPAEYVRLQRSILTLRRIEQPEPERRPFELKFDDSAGRSEAVILSAGTYELALSGGLEFRTQLSVDGGVTERRRIEVPPPTRFRVRFVADRGGELGLPQAFPWSACFGSASSRDFIAICEKGVPGTFELRSPSDQIELRPPREGSFHFVGGATQRLTGGGEHLVQLVRAPRVRLQLFRDGRRIAVPLGLKVTKRKSSDPSRPETDGLPPQQVVRPTPGTPEELQLWFPGPGTYELHLSSLEGYAPLPRVLVRVGASDDRVIEIPVVVER